MFDNVALMNNNDLPLSVYGLRPGCFVTMKVGHKDKETLKKTASKEVRNLAFPIMLHNRG
jgi:hypothetical protein